MNTNTRRSFIQTAIAAIAAFFGVKSKAEGFESRDFRKADSRKGIADFHLGIEPNGNGYRIVISTRQPSGEYQHTTISTGKEDHIYNPKHVNRLVVLQAIMAAIDGKYSAMMDAESEKPGHAIPFSVSCDRFGRTVISTEGFGDDPNQRWEKQDGVMVKVYCPEGGKRMPINKAYRLGDPDFLVFPKE